MAVYLKTRHRVLDAESVFNGTIDGTAVYPRELIKRALDLNAAALIVAHNHPICYNILNNRDNYG